MSSFSHKPKLLTRQGDGRLRRAEGQGAGGPKAAPGGGVRARMSLFANFPPNPRIRGEA